MTVFDSKLRRFKLLKKSQAYYLIDMDTNKIAWLLPYFVWLFPLHAQKISEKEFYDLEKKEVKRNGILSMVIVTTLSFFLRWLFNALSISNENTIRLLFVLIITVLIGAYRLFESTTQFSRMTKELNLTLDKQLKLEQINKRYLTTSLVRTIISYLLIFIFGYYAIITPDNLIMIIYVLWLMIIIFWNRTYIQPVVGKSFISNK